GGIGMPNPVSLLDDDADFLISVDIKKELTRHKLDLNIYDILQRSEEVTHTNYHLIWLHRLIMLYTQKGCIIIGQNSMKLIHWSIKGRQLWKKMFNN
ncbi:MAG: hypothetical protein QGH24_02100, partial [Candidatus Marinimicrobia bacterium]|nr:hypothetical protein [Candidatus Neomarinimicrobiota bacterium]